jgi:hypothetical protein
LPECPRWEVIDRDDLPTLVDKLKYVLVRQELDRPLLTQEGTTQLSIALSGRGLPQRSVVARALLSDEFTMRELRRAHDRLQRGHCSVTGSDALWSRS